MSTSGARPSVFHARIDGEKVEETKEEMIKKDKAATEKLLQKTIEKYQTDLTIHEEFYVNELKLAKEAEGLVVKACANSEELMQALKGGEEQAVAKFLRWDIYKLLKLHQECELCYNEFTIQLSGLNKPPYMQTKALQMLQDVAADANESIRATRKELPQILLELAIQETQITLLKTEQNLLSRSLEKVRQKSAKNCQECLIAKEEVVTQEGRSKQFEKEIKELKVNHKELEEEVAHKQLVEKMESFWRIILVLIDVKATWCF